MRGELTCWTIAGMYGNTNWIVRFLVRCRGAESDDGDPTDDSELDMREIPPRMGETAETERLIALLQVRRAGERLLEALPELSDEIVLMVVL